MTLRLTAIVLMLMPLACSDAVVIDSTGTTIADDQISPPKADQPYTTAVEWANTFFLTQVYDARWNATGVPSDTESNNCGPASFAMVMSQRGIRPEGLSQSAAIDHARALMYTAYPEIDDTMLSEGARQYTSQGQLCINDDHQSVYFDTNDTAPSIAQGIENVGGAAVFGYSWSDIRQLLDQSESLIAYGHITDDWRRRFPSQYGQYLQGGIPHFIAVFSTSNPENFIVCDPMHLGGPIIMTQNQLQTFFKSPINVFETSIRVIAWSHSSTHNTVTQDERRNEPREP